MMNTIIKKGIVLLAAFSIVGCLKHEPLDLEAKYKKEGVERAKLIAEKQAELLKKEEDKQEKAWDAYYEILRDYKEKAWAGEKPFIYMFWTGWRAQDGLDRTWLQSIPDSTTAISLWGGYGKQPEDMTENELFDLDIFHRKGGAVVLCYQVSSVGLGLPGVGNKSGFEIFRDTYDGGNKLPTEETKRAQIYARELARYIIACNLDGFDIDWEPTVGDHGSGYHLFAGGQSSNGFHANMQTFIQEISKYFGTRYSGAERKQQLDNLFNENFEGYHPAEKTFIQRYKPFYEKYYFEGRKYYLLLDGQFPNLQNIDGYFDKYILQDYGRVGVVRDELTRWSPAGQSLFPQNNRFSSTAEFEKGHYREIVTKAESFKRGQVGGFSSYHGELDFVTTVEDISFKKYLHDKNIQGRKYKNYAWMREATRVADPRPAEEYKDFKEELIIRKPKK